MFQPAAPGSLVPITGSDPALGAWEHRAFLPSPLSTTAPNLSVQTNLVIGNARAALAALDSTARQLPNPRLLRLPTLRREAQSTSALEGTYAPLADVLIADDEAPTTPELTEILNYVAAANFGFSWIADGRPFTTSFVCDLQGRLMKGTPLEPISGRLREGQVVIGQRPDADPREHPVHNARFIPCPPGLELEAGLSALVSWLKEDHSQQIDPVVATAMSHYQFETLHPFHDGNGRIGRLLIVLHLVTSGILSEPTLTVSPWFEARRTQYYDALLSVSTAGAWDPFVAFFAEGIRQAAETTHAEMLDLVTVQAELKAIIRDSKLRADSAHSLVDVAIANSSFTVRKAAAALGLSYHRTNTLVGQLGDLGILQEVGGGYNRIFYAPRVLEVLTNRTSE
ncbi:cell filamentation protein Fic [Parenemella sanctibonifatiensis]|uniref:Cell filamentation protein Fic n=2 Tax=Parenemella sanctibonifatiensis TaxID=2016505 RepID=A0A255ELA5_9ACTN|nr:cell filamentation protein Fic [Parenemella sanctibonifatiensis]